MSAPRRAEFSERDEERPHDRPMYPTRVIECWCGWSTTAVDASLYGPPNALTLARMAHRIAHLEGRYEPDPSKSGLSDHAEPEAAGLPNPKPEGGAS